ncbi:bifunctional acetate--CoA ligase family protein/GNAT family N-acetyltransferase [Tuwongella immobilis]|uniref:N-acetyltransferase domain-containing protein n=1 Tax=Tuwongella immobilis TaxID=692036 RepID=A0A6C2YM86_9BACT|nr:bifunctional acetate--CoA ligase family protein/GNAT family N-acetyltransferase [Tuwongella immobilis]VIP02421.1 acetyl synthetase subunit alpha : Acetyl-CoA synthetase OS=Stigmatella aurantiaca (strain DW4/3-1) GN=acs PE=4 SV=1: CoA_binding_2: Succ_CoA_lig: ATP-grasp_5: Acetyltransf_3 [Tuwongella immobilis]VTS01348.1 acetyl synthetase subunit alpha : Acetyl-CoA synthetase OS=Stigmatella aurantiaca (strain DW4/3-1) GN=acs PE=4 SV=1: CoA_binding_2: Succ_CoA_lig: ATP-grasp_5: Acetyltransf_3 [Tuw
MFHDHPLDRIFRPRSVAVIGASATPNSVGNVLMRNLLGNPFGGVIYPVNPNRRAVQGVRCYSNLAEIPDTIDLAIIAVKAELVPSVVADCVDKGVAGAIILSAGFSELGQAGRELEQRILAIAAGKLRIIGPNCLGVMHPLNRLNASFAAEMAKPGRVALLSQSGAVCTSILDWANGKNIGFSAFVSVGAMIDVDWADLIDYFGDDPETTSILLYMESIGDVRGFISAARAVARHKPIIVVKAGRNEISARVAASHTGAMLGSDAVFESAFRRAGVLRVSSIRDLFHMAEVLSMQPLPDGFRLAILTNAGGPAVMAVDALIAGGGQLAPLSAETLAALDAVCPPFWSHANPVDLLGDASPELYRQSFEILSRDPGVDGVLVLLTPQAMTQPENTARLLAPFARSVRKPVLAGFMGGRMIHASRAILSAAGMPAFDTPEAAVRAFLLLAQYRDNLRLLYERPDALPEGPPPRFDDVQRMVARARMEGRTLLTEAESKQLLAAYDIPIVPTRHCGSPEEAIAAAEQLGYPVVLKLESRVISHKTEAGGVRLDLRTPAAVREAFHAIQTAVIAYAEQHSIVGDIFTGVTVQPMIPAGGYELILGSALDEQFGPVIVFGTGGILTEVYQDRSWALPPLNRTLVKRLIERTRIYQALKGVRGRKSIPMADLETLLVRFSQLLVDFPDLGEVEINPLIATEERLIAVDARVMLTAQDSLISPRRLAIHPYPNQYTSVWEPDLSRLRATANRLPTGTTLLIRALRPEDEPLLENLFKTLSEHTIRMRFFRLIRQLTKDNLIRLCHVDYERELALVAIAELPGQGAQAVGIASFARDPSSDEAEFAVVVSDAWQGIGLGRELVSRLVSIAPQRGILRLTGATFRENLAMRKLCTSLGFTLHDTDDPQVLELRRDLLLMPPGSAFL